MRTQSRSSHRQVVDDDYFERKARELVVPDEEIEAWELDSQDLDGLGGHGGSFAAAGAE